MRGERTPKAAKPAGKESVLLDREALRYWRLQRGWTQEALSRQRAMVDGATAGISYAQIRRIEKDGRAGPASARLLAALLGVELAQLRPRDARQLPCGLPRELSVDFVGRSTELDALLALLQRVGEARIAVSIEGLPGVGKTELALQVCGHCERTHAFRIFWLNAQHPDLTPIWAGEVARSLGVEHPDIQERARLVLRMIDSLVEPTLIVLDDVQHWSASQPWPRPQGRHIRWLITTRTRGLGDRAFEHMDLALLNEASSIELMARIAGEQVTHMPGFSDLMRQLGGYTLAVELAAAFLARFPEVEPDEYAKALREGKGELFEAEVAPFTAYQETLDSSLELLWQRLPPSTRSAWELAACFAQEPVSMALSDACSLGRRPRAELRDFHLIRGERMTWSMHALVRAFALRRAVPAALEQARAAMVQGCAKVMRHRGGESALGFYLRDRPHFDFALRFSESLVEPDEAARALLQLSIGGALQQRGETARGNELLLRAIEHCRREVAAREAQSDALGTARARLLLGRTLYERATGGFQSGLLREAVVALDGALQLLDRAQAPREWAAAQRMLGRTLHRLFMHGSGGAQEIRAALTAHDCALQVYRREELPREWAHTQSSRAGSLRALAAVEPADRAALLREAERAYVGALEVLDRESGELEWAQIQHMQAELLFELCEWTGDLECGERAVRSARAALEVQTRERMPMLWAHTQFTLAEACLRMALADDGSACLQEAVEALRAALQECPRKRSAFAWGAVMQALGRALAELGRRQGDAAMLEEAIACTRSALEEFTVERQRPAWVLLHLQLSMALGQLGIQRVDRSRLEEAVANARSALAALDPEDRTPLWAEGQWALAEALMGIGRAAREQAPLREALECLQAAAPVVQASRPGRIARLAQQVRELERELSNSAAAGSAKCANSVEDTGSGW